MRWILTKGTVEKMIIAILFISAPKNSLILESIGPETSFLLAALTRSGTKSLPFRFKTGLALGEYATQRFRNCGVLGKH